MYILSTYFDLFQDLSVFPICGETVGFIVWFPTSSLFLKIACKELVIDDQIDQILLESVVSARRLRRLLRETHPPVGLQCAAFSSADEGLLILDV